MEQINAGNPASAEFAPSLVGRIKRVVTSIGVFFDVNAYKKEIARYETELPDNGHNQDEPRSDPVAGVHEATTS